MLTRALQLEPAQQALLRDILETQRQTVSRVWNDASVSAAERAPIIRAIQEKTADRIRSMLTPAQREHYNPPKPANALVPSADVEHWMQMTPTAAP